MKEAKEWLNEVGETVANAMFFSRKEPPGTEVEELIKRIQDDAQSGPNQLTGDSRNYFTSFLARRGVPHIEHESAASLLGRVAAEIDKMEDKGEQFRKENDILRGIASKVMPCHYCGVKNIAECPHGFPGCALIDDVMAGEDTHVKELRARLEKAMECIKEFKVAMAFVTQMRPGSENAFHKPAQLAEDLQKFVAHSDPTIVYSSDG